MADASFCSTRQFTGVKSRSLAADATLAAFSVSCRLTSDQQ